MRPPRFLTFCRRLRMTPEQYLHMVLDHRNNKAKIAEILQFIYMERRAKHPERGAMQIQADLMNEFGFGDTLLQELLYMKLEKEDNQ